MSTEAGGYIQIHIEPTHITGSGQRYRVYLEGEVLIESARVPSCEAARALIDIGAGLDDTLLMSRVGSDKVDFSGRISYLATHTVTEGNISGPRFVPWSPHPGVSNDE